MTAFNTKAINEEIAAQVDRVSAIQKLATDEKRAPTADEQRELDGIVGSGKPGDDNYLAGKIDQLREQLEKAQKVEALQAEFAANRFKQDPPQRQIGVTASDELAFDMSKVVVPVKAKARSPLRVFKGPDAEKEAYIAGQFYSAAIFGNKSAIDWLDNHGMPIQAAMSSSTNSAGGYLSPDILESTLIRLVSEYGVFRRYARVYPMGKAGVTLIPRRSSGFTAYYVGQNSAITASDLAFDQIRLEAKKLAVLTQVSSELSEESVVALGELITQEMAFVFAYNEDLAGFNGDGTTTYGGIVGLKNALAAGSKQTGGANLDTFAEVVIGEFHGAMAKIARIPGIQPRWFIHPAGYELTMQRLALAAGGNAQGNYNSDLGPMFLGYPVVFTNVLPSDTGDLSDQIFAYFGDLSMAATLGDMRGLTIASDSSYYFNQDALAIRGTSRFDINVHERGTSSAGGPIIALVMGS